MSKRDSLRATLIGHIDIAVDGHERMFPRRQQAAQRRASFVAVHHGIRFGETRATSGHEAAPTPIARAIEPAGPRGPGRH